MATTASPSRVNAVYYPSWRVYRGLTPSSMDLGRITHIIYAFLRVNKDGSLRHIDRYADMTLPIPSENVMGALAALARVKTTHPHIRTLISIGGGAGSAEFPFLAADPSAVARFTVETRAFIEKWSFDGVDLDWEHPANPTQASHYLALLRSFRYALPAPRYLLTTALPTGQYILKHLDLGGLNDVVDYVNLMAYDFFGPWTKTAGHHAQLHCPPGGEGPAAAGKSAASGVGFSIQNGLDPAKIVLGIPLYARTFKLGVPNNSKEACGTIEYRDLQREWVQNATVCKLTGAASYLCEREEGTQMLVSFDVPETLRMKAAYVRSKGLGGLFYWTGTGDRDGAEEGLVGVGFAEMRK
ncbi:glycoside hydrolase superfamily [Chaetomium strumarium]|uniref:chitinase n=1 Tax=Chaetomium strumarium TaxID=1170767 RepID=A0AAJ0M0Y0_9PEZI|nr:glycoside hydrolase superfamily [Chaetomium strumarium]